MYKFASERYTMTTVTTRVPKPMLSEIDKVSKEKHMDRSTLLRNLIACGLQEERKERVLWMYKQRRITLQKVGDMLDITYLDALELLKREDLHIDYGLEELKEDLRGLR